MPGPLCYAPPVPADDLAAWIAELRRRLGASELADLPPIDLRNGLVLRDVELAVWIMLADVDRYPAMPPEWRRRPLIAARRRLLADNLRRLRGRLDGGPPSDVTAL